MWVSKKEDIMERVVGIKLREQLTKAKQGGKGCLEEK